MNPFITAIIAGLERLLFAGRWLMLPIYLAMTVLLGMVMVYFLVDLAHSLPGLLHMTEPELVVLTVSLIDLSLAANLLVLVMLSGYENFVSRVRFDETSNRPEWLSKIDFSGLKLKLLGSITVIAAVHLLGDFLNPVPPDDRVLAWEVVIVIVFALVGLAFALTDRLGGNEH